MSDYSESDFARRVREQLDATVEWDWEHRVARRRQKPTKPLDLLDLPKQRAPAPVGAVGRLVPTPHEMTILRRAARPGGFIMHVFRESEHPVFVFDDGATVFNENRQPLSTAEFARLSKFLVPEHDDALFPDGPPQRWNARRRP